MISTAHQRPNRRTWWDIRSGVSHILGRRTKVALSKETLIWGLLLGVYFSSCLINLTLLPLFVDEGVYLWWGDRVLLGELERGFGEGKPLVGWAIALMVALGADYVAAPRLAQALIGSLTWISIVLLGEHYLSRRTAFIAAVLWIVLPYALLFERLSTPDATMAAFGMLTVYLSVRMTTDRRWQIAGAAGAGIIATILAKSPVGAFFAIAPLAVVVILQPVRAWRKQARSLAMCYALSGTFIGLAALVVAVRIRLGLNPPGFGVHEILAKTSLDIEGPGFLDIAARNIKLMVSWFGAYLTWPLAILLLLAWLAAWFSQSRLIRLVALLGSLYMIIFVLTSDFIVPRYFFPALPFLVIITAWALTKALELVTEWIQNKIPQPRHNTMSIGLYGLATVFVLALTVPLDVSIAFKPQTVPSSIRMGLVEGITSGYGFKEAAAYLEQTILESGETSQVIALHVSDYERLLAYASPTLRPMLRQVHIVDRRNRSVSEQIAILRS